MIDAPSLMSAFVTLFVTVGPIETAAVFASLTAGVHKPERRSLARRSAVIAGTVLLVFALTGETALGLLHISMPAFRVAGGVLLLLQAFTLTFSSPGLSSISEGERSDAKRPGDIAVFPLAFPLIAGPGSLSAVVLLMGHGRTMLQSAGILVMLCLILVLTFCAMRASDWLVEKLGRTGADVVGRVSGVLLAALAVQFIFDGLLEAPFWRRG